jgi:hypothetical protein
MSQAPNPFTQAASQGYGDFSGTLDEDERDDDDNNNEEEELDGPQSPEPEPDADEGDEEVNEHGS